MTTKIKKPASKDVTVGDKAFAEDAAKEKALNMTVEAMKTEQLEMNQLLGRIQATQAIGGMMEALSLSQMQSIKEQKAYKSMQGQIQVIDGKEYNVGTWNGFCKAIGSSERAIDEKLQNLQMFGETALENAQNLGMTTRELRKLRKLDPTDQNVIINELETNIGDKDAIVELIENMSAKHLKDKKELEAKIADEKAERKATDQVIGNKNKKIDELEKKLAREENATPYDRAKTFAEEIAKVEVAMLTVFGDVDKLFQCIKNDAEMPEILRSNQGHLLLQLKDHANEILDRYQLGDVSVDDDQLDWVAAAKAEAEAGQ